MSEHTRNLLVAMVTALVTALGSYFGFAQPAVEKVEQTSERRHLLSCENARDNRSLARDIAMGLLEPLPVPAGALPALQEFIGVANAERARARIVVAERTRQPVECLDQ